MLVTPSLIFDKYLSARQEGVRRGLGRGQKEARRGPGEGQEGAKRGPQEEDWRGSGGG